MHTVTIFRGGNDRPRLTQPLKCTVPTAVRTEDQTNHVPFERNIRVAKGFPYRHTTPASKSHQCRRVGLLKAFQGCMLWIHSHTGFTDLPACYTQCVFFFPPLHHMQLGLLQLQECRFCGDREKLIRGGDRGCWPELMSNLRKGTYHRLYIV